jgi:hypothetical protein
MNTNLWISFCFLMLTFASKGQYSWSVAAGGAGVDISKGVKISPGNEILIWGDIAGNAKFDNVNYNGRGLADGFVALYNQNGSLKWVKLFGGTQNDRVHAADVNYKNEIYVTGHFEDSITVENVGLKSKGLRDIFVAKLDSTGKLIWLKSFGTPADEQSSSLVVDNEDNFYLSGSFKSQLQFGSVSLTSTNVFSESFIVKLDKDGNTIWGINSASQRVNGINSLALSPNYDVVFCGSYSLSYSFGGINVNTSSPDGEIIIGKVDKNGNLKWLKSAGGPYEDNANGITVSNEGNIAITGYSLGVSNFDNYQIANFGYNDAFIALYDSTGNCKWAVAGGGSGLDIGYDICFDNNENVYATGMFDRRMKVENNEIIGQDFDIFSLSLTKDGELRWLKQAGDVSTDCGLGIAVDDNNNIFTTGYYMFRAYFGNILLPIGNAEDIFLSKMNPPVLSLDDNDKTNISIYPNPANKFIYILANEDDNKVTLYNTNLQTILVTENARIIDVSHLENGLYFLSFENQKNKTIKKLIIQH